MFFQFVNQTTTESSSQAGAATSRSLASRARRLMAAGFAGSLLVAACGSDSSTAADNSDSTSAGPSAEAAAAIISTGSTDLGDILVNSSGLSVYGFTDDSKGTSTCEGGCAQAWPPVLVDSAELPAGLDASVFSVIERSDGTHQLQAGDWPLYLFAGDSASEETNGQGSGGVWFVVSPGGGLIK